MGGRNVDGIFKVGYAFQKSLTHVPISYLSFDSMLKILTVLVWYILQVLDDLEIPEELKDMFISIPEEKFRIDISSTGIRKKLGMWIL